MIKLWEMAAKTTYPNYAGLNPRVAWRDKITGQPIVASRRIDLNMSMLLHNIHILNNPHATGIDIKGSYIAEVDDIQQNDGLRLELNNALAFPGLINSHDHLDFNLFPQFGDKKYQNYKEWGTYIHQKYPDQIATVLKVPVTLREDWGMVKNLLCGVTTVLNHREKLQTTNRPIHVHEDCHNLHSVGLEKKWRLRLNNPLKRKSPLVIHIGEGIDGETHKEIDRLIKWNLLQRKLIGVHGVAMTPRQAEKFRALVWCPVSNDFLLDKTAQIDQIEKHTNILFGTDSTLTGGWDIWEHIRYARQLKLLSDAELYNSLSSTAAKVWNLASGEIKKGRQADVVISRNKGYNNDWEGFFSTRPEDILLVMCNGNMMLFDEELLPQLTDTDLSGFSKVYLNGFCKYIRFNVPQLMADIRKYYPQASFPVST
jgi:hypothetical protein